MACHENFEITTKKLSSSTKVLPEELQITWQFWKKKRYNLYFMIFLGMVNIMISRVNLSVAIVGMIEWKTIVAENGTAIKVQDFDWNSKQIGIILSALYYGMFLTPAIGGYFGQYFGNSVGFSMGAGATSFLSLFSPLAARSGYYWFMGLRILIGLLEGIAYPCMYGLWSDWAPPFERARVTTLGYAGGHAGSVVSMFLSGIFVAALGWESIFYIFGGLGCLWYIIWIIFIYNKPENDKYISKDELRYITESIHTISSADPKNIPWKSMLTSAPLLCICFAHFTEAWGFTTLVSYLPLFLKETLNYNISSSGILSSVPYLCYTICLPLCGLLSDKLIEKRFLTIGQARKYFTCFAFVCQTLFLLLVGFLMDPLWSVICVILSVSFGSFAYAGFAVNFFDIAPQYTRFLGGISVNGAVLTGVLAPTITGFIVQNGTADEWRIVFYISAAMYILGCLVYWIFSSGERQPWAKSNDQEMEKQSTNAKGTQECELQNGIDNKALDEAFTRF